MTSHRAYFKLNYLTHNVYFYDFADENFPVQYITEASFEYSPQGTAFASGPTRKQKRIFNISSYVDIDSWNDLDALFSAWDQLRGEGSNPHVEISSTLLGGVEQNYKAFFTAPPSLQKVSGGNNTIYLATTVLTET